MHEHDITVTSLLIRNFMLENFRTHYDQRDERYRSSHWRILFTVWTQVLWLSWFAILIHDEFCLNKSIVTDEMRRYSVLDE